MKTQRVPAVPLITHDPYFSIWSPADRLYDSDTCHWAGQDKPIRGFLHIGGETYRFMGMGDAPPVRQENLTVTATSTIYTFTVSGINLKVRFTSPLMPGNLLLAARPVSYIDIDIVDLDGKERPVSAELVFSSECCFDGALQPAIIGDGMDMGGWDCVWVGKETQTPLSHSGDTISADWGYLYAASPCMELSRTTEGSLCAKFQTAAVRSGFLAVGYDDLLSLMYFGRPVCGYWTAAGDTFLTMLGKAVREHDFILDECDRFDRELEAKAAAAGGEEYAVLCNLTYRQAFAAHKLAADENGDVIFISKECASNGCAGTVDVAYPSAPLFLLYNTELVKGMLRPVFRFASMPVWPFDFAPHDVGRYPYVNGQVYGLESKSDESGFKGPHGWRLADGAVYPPYHMYPENSGIYVESLQMPVEECGNMLILTAAVTLIEQDLQFVVPYLETLKTWADYLMKHGQNPGDQLCTDDFAGHMAQNANLAVKAILGVAAYGIIISDIHPQQAKAYSDWASDAAKLWEKETSGAGHTPLCLGGSGWSQKYNLIWDRFFGTGLFSGEMIQKEIRHYLSMMNPFGIPLDSRADYTKTDWTVWCAALCENRDDFMKFIEPMHRFLMETDDRCAFSDWNYTSEPKSVRFKNRSVQGAVFMPVLIQEYKIK